MHFRGWAARSRVLIVAMVFGAAAVVCAASASASGNHKKLVTISVAYNPNSTNTTIVVAQEKGFFTKNGLKVKLIPSQNTTELFPDLGKTLDIDNTSPPTLLQGAAHGYNPVLFMSQNIETTKHPNTFLMVPKSITKVSQLKGKTIGDISLSGTTYQGPVIYFNKHGVKLSQVRFLPVPLPDEASDLQSGTIQAAVTITPFNKQMEAEGFHNLADPTLTGLQVSSMLDIGWVANAKWAAAHRPELVDFVKAQKQALAWMQSHKMAVHAILESAFSLPASVADTFPWYDFTVFAVKPTYLSAWIKPMKALGGSAGLPKSFNTPVSKLIFKP